MHKILLINSTVVFLGATLFGYWYFVDGVFNPPVVYNYDTQNIQTSKEVYSHGEYVAIYVDFCKERYVSGTSAWSLVDTVKLFYPEKTANAPTGCYEGWVDVVKLPEIVEDGAYHLEGTATQQINPVKKVTTNFKTQQFIIEE